MNRIRRLTLSLAVGLAVVAPMACAADADGVTSIDKVNGSIDAVAGQRYGALETVNGAIHIADGVQTGNATTVNGSIKVGDQARTGDVTTVNGSIHLGVRVQAGGALETVNGGIFVDRGGQVGKGVTTVNGAIGLVGTDVGGGIDTVNGDITVGVDSHVHGGIKVEKQGTSWLPITFGKRTPPRIIIGPNAVVDGPLVFEREVKLYVHASARVGSIRRAAPVRFEGAHAPAD